MSAVASLLSRSLLRGIAGVLTLLLGIFLFEIVQAPVIDAMGGAEGLNAIMDRIPPALQAFARTRPEFMAMSGVAGYLSLGFTHPLYLVLASAAVIGYAARTLAGEMDRGSIQIALSRRISRGQVYLSRVLGVVVIALAVAVVGPLGMMAGWAIAQPSGDFPFANFLPLGLNTFALACAIGGLALLGSAAANSAGRVLGWGLALFIVMYFVDYFASIWRLLKPFEPLSLFNYYDPTRILVTGEGSARNLLVLAAIAVAAAAAGLAVFRNRDLPT